MRAIASGSSKTHFAAAKGWTKRLQVWTQNYPAGKGCHPSQITMSRALKIICFLKADTRFSASNLWSEIFNVILHFELNALISETKLSSNIFCISTAS